MAEHVEAVLIIKRQQDLTVAVGLELVAPALQDLFFKAEAVQLAVADHTVGSAVERLHAFGRQAHDGQPAKAHQAERPFHDPLVVRAAHHGAQQIILELGGTQIVPGVTHYTTHRSYPSQVTSPSLLRNAASSDRSGLNKKIRQLSSHFARTNAAVSVVPPKLPTRWACQSLLCALPVESTAAITSGARLPLLAALRGFRGKLTGVRSGPALCAAHTCPRSLKKSG